jgi:phosphonate transport system ATP-binding protein
VQLQLEAVSARHPAARAAAAPALLPIHLTIAAGEQLAVIGPSGAGKTTLLQVMACALRPLAGQLRLGGEEAWTLSRRRLQTLRGRLFLAPQVPPLPPRQRVVTTVLAGRLPAQSLWASLRSLVHPTDLRAAAQALDHFELADKLFERVDRLSGGERQRVGLARALLAPASLWLMDEPLSALDPTLARHAIETLTGQARERGITLVASLHQVDLALAAFGRVVGLRDGALVFDLPSSEVTPQRLRQLYDQHEHELSGATPTRADLAVQAAAATAAPAPLMHCR